MSERVLLASFAHPDDESFGTGGTLARYAQEGVRVELICATRGEAGEISDPSLATSENLGDVREHELSCAAEVMGINPPHFLGYRDSGMAGTPENNDPRCLFQANRAEAIGKVTRLIREIRPQVVVTFEPNGGYGHPDHIAIYQITVAAVAAAADPDQYAEQLGNGLAAHTVSRLYYTAIPNRFFRQLVERLTAHGVDIASLHGPRQENPAEWGMADNFITTVIDVSEVLDRKAQSFWCHRTQLNPDGIFAKALALGEDVWREPMSYEYFMRAQPAMTLAEMEEADLFAGLP